jgi:putative methanogen marker protein 4
LSILEKIMKLRNMDLRIALGVGIEDQSRLKMIFEAIEKAEEANLGKIILVGEKKLLASHKVIDTAEPEITLLELLGRGEVDAAVRGTAKASLLLELMKKIYGSGTFFRIALLETSKGHQFFFAPVGIDEGMTMQGKKDMIYSAVDLLKEIGIQPKVAVLSGGRTEDRGRSLIVDRSLEEGEMLTYEMQETLPFEVKHYGILVEEAMNAKANFILAPDGISGNLLYRTLVHLGSGRSHGAFYARIKDVIIDTSRSAPAEEYLNAIRLASALTTLSKRNKESHLRNT